MGDTHMPVSGANPVNRADLRRDMMNRNIPVPMADPAKRFRDTQGILAATVKPAAESTIQRKQQATVRYPEVPFVPTVTTGEPTSPTDLSTDVSSTRLKPSDEHLALATRPPLPAGFSSWQEFSTIKKQMWMTSHVLKDLIEGVCRKWAKNPRSSVDKSQSCKPTIFLYLQSACDSRSFAWKGKGKSKMAQQLDISVQEENDKSSDLPSIQRFHPKTDLARVLLCMFGTSEQRQLFLEKESLKGIDDNRAKWKEDAFWKRTMHLINDRLNYPKNKQYTFVCSRSSLTNSFLTAELTPAYRGQIPMYKAMNNYRRLRLKYESSRAKVHFDNSAQNGTEHFYPDYCTDTIMVLLHALIKQVEAHAAATSATPSTPTMPFELHDMDSIKHLIHDTDVASASVGAAKVGKAEVDKSAKNKRRPVDRYRPSKSTTTSARLMKVKAYASVARLVQERQQHRKERAQDHYRADCLLRYLTFKTFLADMDVNDPDFLITQEEAMLWKQRYQDAAHKAFTVPKISTPPAKRARNSPPHATATLDKKIEELEKSSVNVTVL